MTDLHFAIMALIIIAVVSSLVTWLIASQYYNKKIEGFKKLKNAIEAHRETVKKLKYGIAALTKEQAKVEDEVTGKRIDLEEIEKEISAKAKQLKIVEDRTQELVEMEARASEIRDTLNNGEALYEEKLNEITEKEEEIEKLDAEIYNLKGDLDLYSRIEDFVDFGLFEEPEYLYETSDRYNTEISAIRSQQKKLVSEKNAVHLPDGVEVNGTSKKGTAVLNGQSKLMLKTFNVECDKLIGKVTPANFQRTLERIEKLAETLEKDALSLQCGINLEYVKLKYEECKLFYEFKLKKAAEQEEQRLIREQIREEQKAIAEYEKAIKEAEKEEKMYQDLLEKAKDELSNAHEDEKAEFQAKILLLEEQLKEAEAKEERAKSLAEQTRRGHVYVISNIGSFGEDVYKIGLTRRLDPLDRVKELGDASVPFKFDVHAIIYSDDAPAMESTLHRKFNHRRVNAVNLRKEFFRVTLPEIKSVVDEMKDDDVDFKMTALAEEFYETLRLQGAETSAA